MKAKTLILRSQALLLLLTLPAISDAQTLSNGTGGGDWNNVVTWNGTTIPTSNFSIQVGDVVTAGPGSTLSSNSNSTVFGTLTINGGDFQIGRLNHFNTVTSGTVNMNSGRLSAMRLATHADSNFTFNITGGLVEARESTQAVNGGNTFNVSGGRLSVAGPLSGSIHLSGGSIEFVEGMSSFGIGNANSSWNGGRVYVNTRSISVGSWTGVQTGWSSNAINEFALSSKDTAQTFTVSTAMNAAQGTLVFNIYSPTDNDLLSATGLTLGEGVLIKIEGVNLEGSIEDYKGKSYKILDATNNNYSNIAATLDLSSMTIGGMLHEGIEWDTSNLAIDGTISFIPEPSTYALMFGGLAIGLAIVRRRKQAA